MLDVDDECVLEVDDDGELWVDDECVLEVDDDGVL